MATPQLVVLIGPAGVGKTTIGRALAERLGIPFADADDLHPEANRERMRSGLPLTDEHRWPWLDRVRGELVAAGSRGSGLVLACSALKRVHRERLARGSPGLRFVQLEVDEATLHARLAARTGHFFPATLLADQLRVFEPLPRHARIAAAGNVAAAVAAAIANLAADGAPRLVDARALPAYDLGPDHPFASDRMAALFDLMDATGVVHDDDLLVPPPASDDELATVHDPAYIAAVAAASAAVPTRAAIVHASRFGLGPGDTPVAPGLHAAAAAIAGGALRAADLLLAGDSRAVFHPAGGLHHAQPEAAAGFCVYNDCTLAIRRARARGAARVLYVDFDVHHGDGVEHVFAADPTVLTISFHETPELRYPGTGFVTDIGIGDGRGYAMNVPWQPCTADASFAACTDRVLRAAFAGFRPDFVVSQHGCDTHRDDPLATLACTTTAVRAAAALVRELADTHCDGRWLATGGGGYRPYTVLPRAWTAVWAELTGRTLPPEVPQAFRERWRARAGQDVPATWTDPPDRHAAEDMAAAANERTVDALFAAVPWLAAASR